MGECRSPFESSNKIKVRQNDVQTYIVRFVEKGRLLSTVCRPFLILKTFGGLNIYSYICCEH